MNTSGLFVDLQKCSVWFVVASVKTASVPVLVKSSCSVLKAGYFPSRTVEDGKASHAVLEGSGYAL